MAQNEENLPATRSSLLLRLKNSEDQASWQRFFETYWPLIYGVARKSGLSDAEAQDVVQETMVAVSKQMPSFRHDPALGSFKAWLLNLTRWRITDQLRRRIASDSRETADSPEPETKDFIDPASPELNHLWETEWQDNLLAAALVHVRRRADPLSYQIFDFYVKKEWPAEKVAHAFNISVDKVYSIKHRVTEMLKEEVRRLEADSK